MMSLQACSTGRPRPAKRRAAPRTERRIVPLGAIVVVLVLAAILPLSAQRKASTGPRALGVLVIPKAPAAAKKPSQPYLIPITLWFQNRYLDAQLYGARPEPMALDGGVVYETRRGGEALGLFTVDSVAQQENKRWLGGGTYQTIKEIEARAAARKERNKPPTEISRDEGPPRLRRSDSKPASSAPESAPPPASAPSSPAPPSSAPASSSTPATTPPAQPPAAKSEPAPAAKPSVDEDDPDRPRLHRAPAGEPQQIAPAIKPGPTQLALPPKNTPAPASAPQTVLVSPANAPEVLVAISDEKTSEPRAYDFSWSADEKTMWTKATEQIANNAIANFLERRYRVQPPAEPARTPASRSRTRAAAPPAPPAPEPLQNEQLRALDVQTDNYPELILTAQRIAQVPGPDGGTDQRTMFVMVVVKVDSLAVDRRNQFRPMFTYVTDDRHLDELPKLQLIDPVDADGDGVGELLFRETFSLADEQNPAAWGFQLFRVGVDKLEKLYDSEGKIE